MVLSLHMYTFTLEPSLVGFTTTGNCNSQRIKLKVDGLNCDDCGNIKMF